MPSLQSVFSDSTQLASFSLTNCPALTTVHLDGTTLHDLDLTAFPLLENVWAENFVSLNVSGLTHLTYLNCDSVFLSSLNVAGCTALTTLTAMDSHVTNFDVSGLAALQNLDLGSGGMAGTNPPTHFNASGCTSLQLLNAFYCNIATMDLTGCTSLLQLNASANNLENAVFTGCIALHTIDVSLNNLTMLDVSDCHALTQLNVGGNPLQFIFIKNGSNEHMSFTNFPAPQYICADDTDLPDLLMLDTTVTTANSYCSFALGGDYNTIEGDVHYDTDGNGCGAGDPAAIVQIGYNDGTTQYYTYALNGHYHLYTGAGNIQLLGNFPPYWTAGTPSPVYFADNQNHSATYDFCLTPNGMHHNIAVYGMPHSSLRPGFDFVYDIQVYNTGNQTESGPASVIFDDTRLSVVSLPPGASATGNEVTVNYAGLHPFERKDMFITFHVNAPTDTPPVNAGDVLDFTVNAPLSGDEYESDNTMDSHEWAVNSFDPNEIICAEGDVLPTSFIGQDLHYIVNFENTGTANAENVVIKSMVDPAKYDISTLQPMGASHNVNTVITGNKVEFQFQGIGLAPNEYGYVAYSIKSRNTLAAGDSVSSSANIYFDFNAPVVTNTATTTFQALGVPSHVLENQVSVYPNPATHTAQIKAPSTITDIAIVDAQGRTLRRIPASENQVSLPLDGLASGVYQIVVETTSGRAVKKLIKT